MAGTSLTPLKAIRRKCLDCCCDNGQEVRRCAVTQCPLHPFRFGRNPSRAGIGHSDGDLPCSLRDSVENGVGVG